MTHSTTLSVFHDDVFTDAELRTLAGFLGGYSGLTRDATRSISANSPNGATTAGPDCSPLPAATSKPLPATSKISGALGPRSRDGCARSRVCTGMPSKKDSSTAHQRSTSAGHAWTMSPTRLVLTATRSGQCSSPPAWPEPAITL